MKRKPYCSVARNVLNRYCSPNIRFSSTCHSTKSSQDIPPILASTYSRTSGIPDSSLTDSLASSYEFFAYPFKSDILKRKYRGPDPRIASLTEAITNQNVVRAQHILKDVLHEDPKALKNIPRNLMTRFMCLYENSKVQSVKSIDHMAELAEAIKNAGYQLNAIEYAQLISCSYKAHRYEDVDKWWDEVNNSQIEKTTDLWNSYMQAATNGFPKFWTIWKHTKDSPIRRFLPVLHRTKSSVRFIPYARENASDVLNDMIDQGAEPNSRTYELMMLYFAQIGELDKVRIILHKIWGIDRYGSTNQDSISIPSKGTDLYPTLSTLSTISDSFGFNNAVDEGLYYVKELQQRYKINVQNALGRKFWSEMLKWIYYTSKDDNASTSKHTFELVWKIIRDNYQIYPSVDMYRWRSKRLASLGQYNEMINDIPQILAIPHESHTIKLKHAAWNLNRVVRALCINGDIEKAFELLEQWSPYSAEFENVKQRCQQFMINNRGVKGNIKALIYDRDVDLRHDEEALSNQSELPDKEIPSGRNIAFDEDYSSEKTHSIDRNISLNKNISFDSNISVNRSINSSDISIDKSVDSTTEKHDQTINSPKITTV